MNEWILKEFIISRDNELILYINSDVTILTNINDFLSMFGTAVQYAIDNGLDVKQAIRESDPENTLGFNELL